MGFMSAIGTGFANAQNKEFDDQRKQQDDLTKLSLANILKNVDSYNASKAEYTKTLQKATSLSSIYGGQPGDAMTLLRAGVPEDQIALNLSKIPKAAPVISAASTQTQAALGSPTSGAPATGGTSNLPAPPGMGTDANTNPAIQQGGPGTVPPSVQHPDAVSESGGVRKTIWDHMLGTDPSSDIASNAQGQASQVTGLGASDISQARTGTYSPTDTLPSTPGFKIDPASLVDWSGFNPANYSSANIGKAHDLWSHGLKGDALALSQNATDKQNAELMLKRAEAGITASAAGNAFMKQKNFEIQSLFQGGVINPATSKPYTEAEAKAHAFGVDKLIADSEINPQGLVGDDYLKAQKPEDAALMDALLSGRKEWRDGLGGKGFQASQELFKKLMIADPSYTPAVGKLRNNMFTEYNGTKPGTIGSIRTSSDALINHLFELNDVLAKMNNGPNTFVNDIKNFKRNMTSDPTIQDATQFRGYAVQELAKILHGPGTTPVEDTRRAEAMIPIDRGGVDPETGEPANQHMVNTAVKAIMDRLEPWADQYNDVMGESTPINGYHMLKKASIDKLKAMGADVPDLEISRPLFASRYNQLHHESPDIAPPKAWTPPSTDTKVQ